MYDQRNIRQEFDLGWNIIDIVRQYRDDDRMLLSRYVAVRRTVLGMGMGLHACTGIHGELGIATRYQCCTTVWNGNGTELGLWSHDRISPERFTRSFASTGTELAPWLARVHQQPTTGCRTSAVSSYRLYRDHHATAMTKWSHISPIIAASTTTSPQKFTAKLILFLVLFAGLQLYFIGHSFRSLFHIVGQLPLHAEQSVARCASLTLSAGPPTGFHNRPQSDRFVPGTKPTLLHNARIWTGEDNGTQILPGDIFIDKGIIKGVGNVNLSTFGLEINAMIARGELDVVDVHGAWVTPGCVCLEFDVCPSWW
jgi:hypothetical protein